MTDHYVMKTPMKILLVCILLNLTLSSLAFAQTPLSAVDEPDTGSETLLGNWGGIKTKLSDKGFDISLIYKAELNRNLSGGNKVKTSNLENLDFKISIDGEKTLGQKGLSFFIYALGDKGADSGNVPSVNAGDAQGVSNIESIVDDFKIYELWAQKLFFEDKVSLLAGLHDLNSEFYVTDSSSQFFNASFGVGRELSQTGVNGPSIFPYTSAALRLKAEPTKNFYMQTALFDAKAGDPNHPKGTYIKSDTSMGSLYISEAGYLSADEARPAKYAVGVWSYNQTFDHLSETVTDSNGNIIAKSVTSSGYYMLADKAVTDDVSIFMRYGRASTQANNIDTCITAGVVIKNPMLSRSKDKLGIGITTVTPGSEYKKLQKDAGSELKSAEIAYEINYRIEVLPGLALQPDYQFIRSPSFSSQTKDSQYGALRVELNF